MSTIETLWSGDPLDVAIRGVGNLSARSRRSHNTYATPIEEEYGTHVSDETANILGRLYRSKDGIRLIRAVEAAGLHEMDSYERIATVSDSIDTDDPDLGQVMGVIDQDLTDAKCPRDIDAAKVTTKSNRPSVYIPEVELAREDTGDVYMAKTLSSSDKVRIAWDLDDANQVIVVDEYEIWEELFGWKKLKNLPHGRNKIREELGDQLSDDLLEDIAPAEPESDDTDSDSDTSDSSRGRKTRTKPSEEILNVAVGSRMGQRSKIKAADIADVFEDGESLGFRNISALILFPSTTNRNMSDHWWIPGSIKGTKYSAAIANCNKGTFEYLNQYENVWHVEDFIDQASSYTFETNKGEVSMEDVDVSNLVFHTLSQDARELFMRQDVIEHMPEKIAEYANENVYNAPEFPDPDEMIYAPILGEDTFWLLPELLEQTNPDYDDAIIAYANSSPRNVPKSYNISSDYKLYARARLHKWDFENIIELEKLDDASYHLELDTGGFEVVETLGKLHDNGMMPYSESPEARWDDAQ